MTSYTANYTFSSGAPLGTWTATTGYVGALWSGDLDGDGRADDLIVPGASYPPAGNTPQPGLVLTGNGQGHFSAIPRTAFPYSGLLTVHPREIAVADFNGDGRADVFIASHGYDANPFPGEQNRLFLSNGDGTWSDATSTLPQLLDFSHSVTVGDINGDGYIDIFVGNIWGQQQIPPYFLINDGRGHFSRSDAVIPNRAGQPLSLANGFFTSSLLEDFDNDGRKDLVVGSAVSSGTGGSRSILFWNTGGTFDQSHVGILPEGVLPDSNRVTVDLAAIDLNNDGYLDLLTLSTANNPFYVGTYIDAFINQGNGTFVNRTNQVIGASASHPSGGWSVFLTKMDVNDDGFTDVVLPSYSGQGASADSVFVLLNDRAGHLVPVTLGGLTTNVQAFAYNSVAVQTDHGVSFVSPYVQSGILYANELVATGPIGQPKQRENFLGSGKSDLLLQNGAGAVVVGEIGASGQESYSQVAALGLEWKFGGNGDFLGDGSADFLIRNGDGAVVVGDVQNGSAVYTTVGGLGSEWTFVETGAFLGNGHDQFLIENNHGAIVVGDVRNGEAQYTQVASLGSEWKFRGTGDFLGKGHDQFLIENDAGAIVVGDVQNGEAQYTQVASLGSEWKFKGAGDFLGVGHDAFLIENDAGAIVVGDVRNGHAQYAQVAALGHEWSFLGTGDYLGDGSADFVIQNTAGAVFLGTIANGQASYAQVGALGSEWTSYS